MKKFLSYFIILFIFLFASCSKDEPIPEVTFPAGTTDYFQSSVDFDNKAGEKTITFTSNVPWSANVDDTRDGSSWCEVSPSSGEAGQATIKIAVKENTTYDDRNAVVRLTYGDSIKNIFINQKQLDALTLTSNRFEVPVSGGSITVEVKSNIDYQVKIADDCKNWIHESNTQSTRTLVASNLTFSIDPSYEYDKREGQIEIVSGDKKEIVTIYQAGEGILTLTKKEFNLSNSEQDITIEVNSNFEYSVELPLVDWITENSTNNRAMSTHTINLHIKENQSYDNRSTSLRVFDKNSNLSEEVVIVQSQTNVLQLDKKEYSFDENGGSFTVNINSNVDYKIKIGDSWIMEETTPTTRALVASSHTFKVAEMNVNGNRESKITISDETTGLTDEIIVKQINTFYLNSNSLELTAGDNSQLLLTNNTGISEKWESTNDNVATVDDKGNIKALAKGNATITVSTLDGKHKCECKIVVKDITDYISAYCGGGSIMSNNGLILYGSSLNWYFKNGSNNSVTLKSLQLIDGQTGRAGNEMSVDTVVAAGKSIGYSVSVGMAGIHTPVTCRYKYEFNGKTYIVEAVYRN